MRTSLVLAAVLAVSAACGSGSPAPAPGPAGPEPSGTPTTATPSEPGAPSEPGTPSQPAPPTDPVSPPPTPPAPPAEPDRFVDVERIDADPECDALVPPRIPAPVTVHVDGEGLSCGGGLSEGGGHVAVVVRQYPQEEWQAFSTDGRAEQRFVAGGGSLAPQPDGWLVARSTTPSSPYSMRVEWLSGDGSVRRSETPSPGFQVGAWRLAEDPLGGALLTLIRYASDPSTGCERGVWRYDASGAPRGAPASICAGESAVSTLGEAFLTEGRDGGRVFIHWLRPDGTEARPPADAESSAIGAFGFNLAPLLDGSIAGGNYASWFRRYPHLAAAGESAPPWLAARDGRHPYRFARGNRGYAFFVVPWTESTDCRQVVELLAPSGRLCVRLTFREDATDCPPHQIDQGWDGTVVQQSGKDPCTWRWWPALLGE